MGHVSLEHLLMDRLAARWSELVLTDADVAGMHRTEAVLGTGSVLRPPAGEAEIAAAEDRLGCRLPPSYREFLAVSDGAYADLYGVTWVDEEWGEEDPPAGTDAVGVALLPVGAVRWLRDSQPETAELYETFDWRGAPAPADTDGAELANWAPVARGLQIGRDHCPGLTVLIPFNGQPDWQLWNVHKETSVGYRSFRTFLEHEVALREPVDDLAEVAALIRRAGTREHLAALRLSRVVNPDAVPLLAQAARDPRFGAQAALGLGRIGTADAVAALADLPASISRDALMQARSEEALDVLHAQGDAMALFLLGDPNAVELATWQLQEVSPDDAEPGPQRAQQLRGAIVVIEESGDARAADLLVPLLQLSHQLRFHAACALARLGHPAGEEELRQLARGPQPGHAHAAEQALRRRDGWPT